MKVILFFPVHNFKIFQEIILLLLAAPKGEQEIIGLQTRSCSAAVLQCHLASENCSERVKSCRDKFRYGNFCCLKTICTKNGCRVFGVRELCQCCTGRGGQIWFRDSGPATPPCSVLSAPANTQPDTDGPKHSPASSPGLCPLSSPLLQSSCHV